MSANADIERLGHMADILMGAAHADGVHQREEAAAIGRVLCSQLGQPELPAELRARIEVFDPAAFDLARSCGALGLSTSAERRQLLQLVAVVTEVDEVHDFDESDYIVEVARAIGAGPEDYAGLTVDVKYEALPEPPPVPDDGRD
jgi:uncharacterized tellurite resistance protein B-like protein